METKRYVFESEEEWLKAREPLFTSSEINRLMAEPTKKQREAGQELSDGAITYVLEVCANIEAAPKPMYYNAEMMWGKDTEPEAALELCNQLGLDVNSNDVIYTSHGGLVFFSNGKSGGTPDQIFYGLKAISEIKCPNSATHLYYKRFVNSENFQSELPKYYDQIQHNLFLTGMDKAYFFSFDPRFKKKNLQSHIIEIPKDQERIDLMVKKINAANELKNSIINN
jgi:hypothetical protein